MRCVLIVATQFYALGIVLCMAITLVLGSAGVDPARIFTCALAAWPVAALAIALKEYRRNR